MIVLKWFLRSMYLALFLCVGAGLNAYATSADPTAIIPPENETFSPDVTAIFCDSSNPFDVLENLIHARDFYSEREFHKAATAYRTVFLHDPNVFEARLGLAESLYALGQVRRSSDVLKLSDLGGVPNQYLGRSTTLRLILDSQLSPTEMSATDLRAQIKSHPNDVRLYIALARYYDQQKKWTESRSVYAEALAIEPYHATLRNNFGMSLLSQGQFRLAQTQFSKAFEINPENRLYDNNRRLMLILSEEKDRGLSDITSTRQAALLTDAALLLDCSGQSDQAERLYADAIEIDPSYNPVAAKRISQTERTC